METKTMKNLSKNITLGIVPIMLIFLFTSCSQKVTFSKSSVVPAAEGSVTIKKDKNNNYTIDLSVMRLADPSRLSPPKAAYFVWMETAENGVKNIGQLKTSSGLFSKSLKSSLKTVTPFKPTSFFITGEENTTLQYPGSLVVLRTDSF